MWFLTMPEYTSLMYLVESNFVLSTRTICVVSFLEMAVWIFLVDRHPTAKKANNAAMERNLIICCFLVTTRRVVQRKRRWNNCAGWYDRRKGIGKISFSSAAL